MGITFYLKNLKGLYMGKYITPIAMLDKFLVKNDVDEKIRQKIVKHGENIKIANKPEIIAEACFNAMTVMDELLDEKTKMKVREDCACCLGGEQHKKCKEVNKNYESIEERIKAINETNSGFGYGYKIIEKGKYEITFYDESSPYYRKCVCLGMRLNSINKKWSKTWCYCCGGHVKHHLQTILGKKVNVKILSSALTSIGKKGCHFELKEV